MHARVRVEAGRLSPAEGPQVVQHHHTPRRAEDTLVGPAQSPEGIKRRVPQHAFLGIVGDDCHCCTPSASICLARSASLILSINTCFWRPSILLNVSLRKVLRSRYLLTNPAAAKASSAVTVAFLHQSVASALGQAQARPAAAAADPVATLGQGACPPGAALPGPSSSRPVPGQPGSPA